MDAERGGCLLLLADRLQREPPHALVHPAPDPQAEDPDREHDVEPDDLGGELQPAERGRGAGLQVGVRRRPERAAGLVAQRDDDQARDLGEREGDEREVMADDLEAEARVADRERGERGGAERGERAQPRREAEMVPEHHHAVGADAHEGAVPEADEPHPPHQRPARVDVAPEEHEDEQVQRVVADAEERHGGEGRHDRREGPHLPPRIPCGRQNMTAMKKTNAMT